MEMPIKISVNIILADTFDLFQIFYRYTTGRPEDLLRLAQMPRDLSRKLGGFMSMFHQGINPLPLLNHDVLWRKI